MGDYAENEEDILGWIMHGPLEGVVASQEPDISIHPQVLLSDSESHHSGESALDLMFDPLLFDEELLSAGMTGGALGSMMSGAASASATPGYRHDAAAMFTGGGASAAMGSALTGEDAHWVTVRRGTRCGVCAM